MLLSLGTTAFAGEMGTEEVYQRVEFEPGNAVVTVYAGEEIVSAEEDGSYLLAPGVYTYDAEAEGYVPAVKAELKIETVTAETLKVELEAVPVVEEPIVEEVTDEAAATNEEADVVNDVVENDVVENNVVENDVVENNVVENDVVENNVVENDVVENNVVENNVVENNVVENNVVENNVVDEEIVEEIVEQIVEEPVVVENAIVTQPADVNVVSGEVAGFAVETTGEVASYQWQYSSNGRRWNNLDARWYGSSEELNLTVSRSDSGCKFRVVVTFADGTEMTSEAATLTVSSAIIVSQPQDLQVAPGENASFSVETKGSVSSYQWQYSADGRRWHNLSTWTYGSRNVLSFTADKEDDGLLFRVVVMTRDWSKLTSESAKLTVAEPVPEVTYEARTLEPEVKSEDFTLSVDAPEGALPSDAVLNVEAVDTAPYEELTEALLGDVEIAYALDINFTTEAEGEIEPAEGSEVIVSLIVPGLSEHPDAQIVHFTDDGMAKPVTPLTAAELGRELEPDEIAFKASSFSVYTLNWTVEGADKSAEIHWGAMENGAWNEFNKTSIDESTGSFSLRGLYDGYTFVQAYYFASELTDPTTGTEIEAFVSQAENGAWQYSIGENTYDIADGSHLYAVYVKNGSEGAPAPIPAPGNKDPLNTQKSVVANKNADGTPDGTYKITLSVTGDQVVTETPKNANVVLVLDQSISMQERVSGNSGPYRYEAVRDAALTLINSLPTGGTVDMAIVTFGTGSQTPQNWVTINSTNVRNNLAEVVRTQMSRNNCNKYGTNWDSGLNRAKSVADQKASENEATFIIFLTDGCPSVNDSNNDSHGSAGTTNASDLCISNALTRMNAIVGAGYTVYGIYANTTGNNTRVTTGGRTYSDPLAYVMTASNVASVGGGYVQASDSNALNTAFANIASNILSYLGYNNVQVNDGVTDLTNVSAAVSTSGPAGNFVYTRDGGTNVDGTKKYDNEIWDGAPTASASDTGVTWDLATAGNLEAGVTYSVSFDIWPSQEAYDLIADLNNGKESYDSLDDDVKAQIGGTGPSGYYLLTNTFLNTTYTFEGDPDTTYSVTGDKGTNAMPLDAEKISLMKFWPANQLDNYGEGQAEGGVKDQITLTVTQDGTAYVSKTLVKSDDDPETGWIPASGQEDVYLSCGVMTVKDGVVSIKDGSTGHDYTVTEPGIFSYYWDLIADVYHPMIINGKMTMLVLDETKTAQDIANGVYQIGTDNEGNPKFYRTEAGKVVVGQDGSTTTLYYLEAHNYRRSNLNLTKEILDPCDVADTAFFTYEATITDAAGEDVWFSAFKPVFDENGDPVMDEQTGKQKTEVVKDVEWVLSGATAESGSGYYYFPSEGTVTFKIKAGWNVRFLNLLHGSTFSFKETNMDSAFDFNKIEVDTQFDLEDSSATWNEITDTVITGTIVEPNNSYIVTFENNYTSYFYVYHSADNTIEKIANTDSRVTKDENTGKMVFNIAKETKPGFLYGGYYKGYNGTAMTEDEIRAAAYTSGWYTDVKSGVTPYDGDVPVFDMSDSTKGAYDQKGLEMNPENNKVYYLKEVYADTYLKPYTQYTYYKSNNAIGTLWMISDIDDLNYNETGFIIVENGVEAKICTSLTVKSTVGGSNVKLTPKRVFGSVGHGATAGDFLTYAEVTDIVKGGEEVLMYWVTPDGVTVTGTTMRKLSGVDSKTTIANADSDVVMTLT